ncbi:hypothetical protein PanWU01x14_088670 [Parasponia andersonii]|uniref:Uncharacterized protein n=1 Tax=Parasponia andersonii TaxID=3476 RepID=A0A2P5D839_PARAD|nr:hypothetical protein PanWU01x14_088670 [Parasponia andersonii]
MRHLPRDCREERNSQPPVSQVTAVRIVFGEQNHPRRFLPFSGSYELQRGCFQWQLLSPVMAHRFWVAMGINDGRTSSCDC